MKISKKILIILLFFHLSEKFFIYLLIFLKWKRKYELSLFAKNCFHQKLRFHLVADFPGKQMQKVLQNVLQSCRIFASKIANIFRHRRIIKFRENERKVTAINDFPSDEMSLLILLINSLNQHNTQRNMKRYRMSWPNFPYSYIRGHDEHFNQMHIYAYVEHALNDFIFDHKLKIKTKWDSHT